MAKTTATYTQNGKTYQGYVSGGKTYSSNGTAVTGNFTTNVGNKTFTSGTGGGVTSTNASKPSQNAPTASTSKPTTNNVSSTGSAYKPTYGGNAQTGFYKVNQDGSKTAMTESNKQYFPSNYGGNAGNFTYTPSRQEVSMQNGKVAGEAGFGNSTSVFQQTDKNFNYGYNYGYEGNDLYKYKDDGSKTLITDKNGMYVPEYIDGKATGFNKGSGQYWDTQRGQGWGDNQSWRGDTDHLSTLFNDMTWNEKSSEAYSELDKISNMYQNDKTAYEAYKQQYNTSQTANNIFNLIEGNATNNNNMMGMGAISLADDTVQNDVAYLIYDTLQKAGVEGLDSMSGLEIANLANSMGLGALLDPNALNKPYIENQLVDNTNTYNKENDINEKYDFNINSKEIVDALVQSGGINNLLAEGYEVKQDGTIAPKQGYMQWGDTLVDIGEYARNGHNLQGYSDNRRQSETYMQQETNDPDFMYKEPLEYRAKYAPETLTPEMQQDLQYERELKAELDSLSLELQAIDEILGGGGAMGGLSTGGSGAIVGSGSGTGNATQNAISRAIGGGDTEMNGVTSTGKGSMYGNTYGYNMNTIKQFLGR